MDDEREGRALQAAGVALVACVAVVACGICLAAALGAALFRPVVVHGRAALARALPAHPAARALLVLVASANLQGLVLTLLFGTTLLRGEGELLLAPFAPALALARLSAAPGEPAGPYYVLYFVLDTCYLTALALATLRPSGAQAPTRASAASVSGPSLHRQRGA